MKQMKTDEMDKKRNICIKIFNFCYIYCMCLKTD